jgi:hypothetical protein
MPNLRHWCRPPAYTFAAIGVVIIVVIPSAGSFMTIVVDAVAFLCFEIKSF